MIFKPVDQVAVAPPARVRPGLPVNILADPVQDAEFRSAQWMKGQDYFAHVVSRAGEKTFHVDVEGTLFRMDLGNQASVGQTILLKYLSHSPVPTFTMSQHQVAVSDSTADLSRAGHLIDQQLQKAETSGATARYQANGVVTHAPADPGAMANDLKNALNRSGLFYESHLAEFVEGNRSLSSLRKEPQNQSVSNALTLLPQQLAIQENQHLAWRGEIWSGQMMDWDVRLHERDGSGRKPGDQDRQEGEPAVSSQMSLTLPNLGKVTARLALIEGRMQVKILAEERETASILRREAKRLVDAFEKNAQPLDALLVAQHD